MQNKRNCSITEYVWVNYTSRYTDMTFILSYTSGMNMMLKYINENVFESSFMWMDLFLAKVRALTLHAWWMGSTAIQKVWGLNLTRTQSDWIIHCWTHNCFYRNESFHSLWGLLSLTYMHNLAVCYRWNIFQNTIKLQTVRLRCDIAYVLAMWSDDYIWTGIVPFTFVSCLDRVQVTFVSKKCLE